MLKCINNKTMIRPNKVLVLKKWNSHVVTTNPSLYGIEKRHKSDKRVESLAQRIQAMQTQELKVKELQKPNKFKGAFSVTKKPKEYSTDEQKYQTSLFKSYIEACEASGYLNRAYKVFAQIPNNTCKVDVEAYETMLKGLARIGDIEKLRDFWSKMIEDKITPNLKCYTAVFQCLGHDNVDIENEEIIDSAQELLKELESLHFKADDMLTCFPRTQSDYFQLIKGIKIAIPDFVPCQTPSKKAENMYLDNALVKSLVAKNPTKIESQLPENYNAEVMQKLFKEQLNMELNGSLIAMSVSGMCKTQEEFDRRNLIIKCEHILWEKWKKDLEKALQHKIKGYKIRAKTNTFRKTNQHSVSAVTVPGHVFFEILSVEDCLSVIKDEFELIMFSMSETYSSQKSWFMRELGTKIMEKIHVKYYESPEIQEKYHQVYEDYIQWFLDPTNIFARQAFAEAESKFPSGPLLEQEPPNWPTILKTVVGREFFYILLKELKLLITKDGSLIIGNNILSVEKDELKIKQASESQEMLVTEVPALYIISRERTNKTQEEVKPHPLLSKFYELVKNYFAKFSSSHVPMLVPPLPWSSTQRGGYLVCPSEFRRMPFNDLGYAEEEHLLEKCNVAYPVFDSLNTLGCTPWKINKELLDLVIEVFNNQAAYHDILDDLSIPRHREMVRSPQSDCDNIVELMRKYRKNYSGCSDDELESVREYISDTAEVNKMKKEYFSLWCDVRDKLTIANHFRNDLMFFPHNIDFRGRVYPIAPYFHHMGGDLSRSLLLFGKGKVLGAEGFKWLKLHCINLTELKKKAPIEERVAYFDEVLDDILDSANHPFDGKRWWINAEDPWQTLAACIEIRNALNHPQGPENYVSHLTIHQDGSCNGLQHYSALGRDHYGAKYVNVVPGEAPQDIYSEIATLVEEKRAAMQAKNPEHVAADLDGFVKRKVIKQTVMTTVYGVTKYGARLQIEKQLKAIDEFPQHLTGAGSAYLAELTFESLNDMFEASQNIQAWFTECATSISDDFKEMVEWETPLGLHVIQPYTKVLSQTSRASVQASKEANLVAASGLITLKPPFGSARWKPNTIRQRNGFPPNFVHSLDSTHMMLTSLFLSAQGLTFSSVHDCYWTHASTVAEMNKVCRNQFVNLYKQPILEDLSEHFKKTYLQALNVDASQKNLVRAKLLFNDVPKKGSLDIDVVKDSVYFFS